MGKGALAAAGPAPGPSDVSSSAALPLDAAPLAPTSYPLLS